MTITVEEFNVFCRRSLHTALEVVDRLGDELINTRPVLTGGNTPFALVTHMLGAAEWWVGHIVLGEPSDRRRDLEFEAAGSLIDLEVAVSNWLVVLASRSERIAAQQTLSNAATTERVLEVEWTVGAALLHVYEEIAQHLGHLELTADVLFAERTGA